jgi:hypothetical protein
MSGKEGRGLRKKLAVMREILWQATDNNWFEYPMQS